MNAWFIPVENGTINRNAKFHYFENDKSLCNRYSMDTDYFETDMERCKITFSENIVCKQCL